MTGTATDVRILRDAVSFIDGCMEVESKAARGQWCIIKGVLNRDRSALQEVMDLLSARSNDGKSAAVKEANCNQAFWAARNALGSASSRSTGEA